MIRLQIEVRSAVMRAGLRALFESQPGIEVIDSAADADVLLTDETPDFEELSAAPSVIVLSDQSSLSALRSGARAVLPANAEPSQIVAAVHAASAGLVTLLPEDFASLLPRALPAATAEPLTARETEVLEMMAEGISNKAIAYNLSISEHTAKFHVNSILAKLGAGTRTEAVTRGIRLGLIKI